MIGQTSLAGRRSAFALLFLSVAASACVDEKIVYRDGPNFIAPPAAAANFLGYHDESLNRTTCGNCHVTQQGKWEQTAHSDAWATLQASSGKQAACEGCHSVNNRGNAVTQTNVGYTATQDARYHDVQCESCHGPGLEHVTAPTRGQMLASVHADTGAGVTNGCAECHSGTHHPFVEEWRASRHATSYTRAYNGATATAPDVAFGPRSACQGCHIGQKILENWGVNTNFIEKNSGQTIASGEGITCAVCHDPHGSPNTNQLRFPVDSRDPEINLCAKCHNRRSTPDWSQSRDSPHAPHGPLVFGTAGWWPPGVTIEETQSTHGSERNPKLCATCHVQRYNVTDKATGQFQVSVVGHRFLPIPCVDANGAPAASQSCVISARSFKSCSASGCHTEATARSAFVSAESDVNGLIALLDGMIAQVPANQFGAGKVTVGRGAKFNSEMAKMPGAIVHNPFMLRALLRYSGVALNKEYGIPLPPGLAPTAADVQRVRVSATH
jgi:predicted CXXCH cytochrome family protein